MHVSSAGLRLSPSDLSSFLGCRHRTGLDLAVAHRALAAPDYRDSALQALFARGAEHERAYVRSLNEQGLAIVEIETEQNTTARAAATFAAMRSGAEVIVQAALVNEAWTGYADILRRVNTPSALGAWSYEPYDTKLARDTRGGTILQLAVYVDLLSALQEVAPEQFHVVTPGATTGTSFTTHSYRYREIAAYVRMVRRQLAETLDVGHPAITAKHYPEPVEHCEVCRWWERCNQRRRQDDHLSFVAGVTRLHREELTARGYSTLAAAAAMTLPVPFQPSRGSQDTYVRVREQARLQLEQRTANRPIHELLPAATGQGLTRLPEPSHGDLFLDLEGARFAREGGREYLFGLATYGWLTHPEVLFDGVPAMVDPGVASAYVRWWAFDDAEERTAFESLIDRIISTWAIDPGMHVYHFGHYEPSTLKRLMGRHATRGQELDQLLRAGRFVDLHVVVRQALRAGVESYSIKQLEHYYGYTREVSLNDASSHLHSVEIALEGNMAASIPEDVRAAVEGYNRDDCRSTLALRHWLEHLRTQLVEAGTDVSRPVPQEGEPSQRVSDLEQRQRTVRELLLGPVSDESYRPDHPQHPYWVLAYLIDWHRREDKSAWWEFYRLRDLPEQDLFDEKQAIGGLAFVSEVDIIRNKKTGKPTGSVIHRYSYPLQETELGRKGDLRMPGGENIGELVAHDRFGLTIDIRKGPSRAGVHPSAVYVGDVVPTEVQQEALLRFASAPEAESCGTDLLFRRAPRLRSAAFRLRDGETTAQCAVRLATELDRTTLAIQGPPGAGKTYVGAQMIRALVAAGQKVGVTAVSHKVIRNLLEAIEAQERAAGLQTAGARPTRPLQLGHKRDRGDDGEATPSAVQEFDDNDEALAALASGVVDVLGATSWLWSREQAAHAVDVLFVDEAGQMSLANALAVSGAASSLVLLGDPQQLEQPQKGSHPDGVDVSALEHVLGGAATMPPERGLFLPTTWRLHPTICSFTSEVFYEGKLQPKPGLENQRLTGTEGFDGAELWWVPVSHDGSQNYSPEEVDVVAGLVDRLLAPGAMWVDEHGASHQLTGQDLRIVAPFNAQVNRLAERLAGRNIPVGTVDKFQGQEAPIVIYSMATSRPEDAPRGMEFLYSLNRLNVATSRARCAAIIVASPRLFEPGCRTPRQMVLANALCRFRELASAR